MEAVADTSGWQRFGARWRGAAAVLLALLAAGCGGGGGGASTAVPPAGPDPAANPWSLQASNDASLTAHFREALGAGASSYLGTLWARDVMVAVTATTAGLATPGASGAAMSGTTLQEAGVDEADLIKSDGTYVFNLEAAADAAGRPDAVRRQRLDGSAGASALQPVDTLGSLFSPDVRGTGMYRDAERQQLVLLGQGGMGWGIYDSWFAPQQWEQGVTEVTLATTPAASAMQKRRHLRMSGSLIGSRRIGSTLYLVLRSYPRIPGLDPSWSPPRVAGNQAILDALQPSQVLPTLSVDGGAPQPLVAASSCLVQGANAVKSADTVTIVGIDLAASGHRHGARCFVGGSEAFYMSQQSLYLATTRNTYSYSGPFPVYAAQTGTDIHKFSLDGLDMAYKGSGNVTGHLGFDQNRKSFRMGEYQGALRVLTQTDTVWNGWTAASTAASPARLSILQETAGTLAVVGELPNATRPAPLGKPGEQMYASRFIGARGYLVTYRLTDPLYVLDLSNPRDPRIAGELEVSGYSDYLFPLSETLLLGVGKDAVTDGSQGDGRFAWYQGVKVSLIDVSDPAKPVEADRRTIGRRGTDATVLRDHHGIAIQANGNAVRVGLPVSLHDTPTAVTTGLPSDYYLFTRSELQKFEVNLAARTLTPRPAMPATLAGERDISGDRSLLWNDQVHYFQGGSWLSGAW